MKNSIICLFALLAFSAVAVEKDLIFYSSLNSLSALSRPEVGEPATINPKLAGPVSFGDGVLGGALHVKAGVGNVMFPLPQGLPADSGAVEFDAKIDNDRSYYQDAGDPAFYTIFDAETCKTMLHNFELNANNGAAKSGWYFRMPSIGWLTSMDHFGWHNDFKTVFGADDPKAWHHYVIRWNVNGLDGSADTVRVMMDGRQILAGQKTVADLASYRAKMSQPSKLFFGGQTFTDSQNHSDYYIDEFKIWSSDCASGIRMPAPVKSQNSRNFSGSSTIPIFYSKFDSAQDITSPTFGSAGKANGASFAAGKDGQSLLVVPDRNTALFPFDSGLPEVGCVEFDAKMSGSENFGTAGSPLLFCFVNRDKLDEVAFIACFNANNGAGSSGLLIGGLTGSDIPLWPGKCAGSYPYSTILGEKDPMGWHHYQIAWNQKGLKDGGWIAVAIDGKVILRGVEDNAVKARFFSKIRNPLSLGFGRLPVQGTGRASFFLDDFKVWSSDTPISTVVGKQHRSTKPKHSKRVINLKDSTEVLRQKQLAAQAAVASQAASGLRIDEVPNWAVGTYVGGGDDGKVLFIVEKSGVLAGRWTTAEKVWKMKAEYFGAYDATNEVCAAEVSFESDGETMKKVIEVTPRSAQAEDFEAWVCEWDVNPVWRAVAEKLAGKMAEFDERGTMVHLEIVGGGLVKVSLSRVGVVRTCESTLIPVEDNADEYRVFVAVPADKNGFNGFVGEFVLNGKDL